MKLIRHGDGNKEKPGIYVNGINYDVSGFVEDATDSQKINFKLINYGSAIKR